MMMMWCGSPWRVSVRSGPVTRRKRGCAFAATHSCAALVRLRSGSVPAPANGLFFVFCFFVFFVVAALVSTTLITTVVCVCMPSHLICVAYILLCAYRFFFVRGYVAGCNGEKKYQGGEGGCGIFGERKRYGLLNAHVHPRHVRTS